MRSSSFPFLPVVAGLLLAPMVASAAVPASCTADSGAHRAVLVELYTSEGCSSCPPADRALSRLAEGAASTRIVPIALHVDYWDSIGWKDRFAQPAFARRQAWEVAANGHRTSFTPHFFVDGRETLDWRVDLAERLRPVAGTASARLRIEATRDGDRLRVSVASAPVGRPTFERPLQLFVAVTESGIRSQVGAGENRGAVLAHDRVVRRLLGPVEVTNDSTFEQTVDLPGDVRGNLAVAAFLQDARSAEVLQAVDTRICRGL